MRPFSHARPFLRNRFLSFIQLSLPEGSPMSQSCLLMGSLFQLSPLPSPLACQTSIRHCRGLAHRAHLTSAACTPQHCAFALQSQVDPGLPEADTLHLPDRSS